jgi:hypothetical protein
MPPQYRLAVMPSFCNTQKWHFLSRPYGNHFFYFTRQ